MEAHPTTLINQTLAAKYREGSSAAEIASVVARAWREIEHSLSQVIGAAGVAALCKRSAHLAARDHAFLASHTGPAGICDPVALETTLASQTREDAAAAGAAVLIQFNDLLAKLVGPQLTDRLLISVWGILSNDLPSKEASL